MDVRSSALRYTLVILASLFLLQTGFTAGLQERWSSPSIQGNAGAGSAAMLNDVSALILNPSILGTLAKGQLYLGGDFSWRDLTVKESIANHTFNTPGLFPSPISVAVSGTNSNHNVFNNNSFPFIYAGFRLKDNIVIGVGYHVPYYWSLKYNSNSVLRFISIENKINSSEITPAIAYQICPQLSLGLGIPFQYIKLSQGNYNGPYTGTVADTLIAANYPSRYQSSDWRTGFTLGVLYQYDAQTTAGVGYQSAINHKLKGHGTQYTAPGEVFTPPNRLYLYNNYTSVKTKLEMPQSFILSAARVINPWTIKATLQYTYWNSVNKLIISTPAAFVTKTVIPLHWKNTWYAALGGDYHCGDKMIFRGGLAYDQDPTQSHYRDARFPDGSHIWLSLGASYFFDPAIAFDAAITHGFTNTRKINIVQGVGSNASNPPPIEVNQVVAKYRGHENILSVAMRISL